VFRQHDNETLSKSCASVSDGKLSGYRMVHGTENEELCCEEEMVACSGKKCRWSKQLICSGNSFAHGKFLCGRSVAVVCTGTAGLCLAPRCSLTLFCKMSLLLVAASLCKNLTSEVCSWIVINKSKPESVGSHVETQEL